MRSHVLRAVARKCAATISLPILAFVSIMAPVAIATPAARADVTSPGTLTATLVQTVQGSQLSPPSPDSSGITYLPGSDRLLMADSEVDEMPIFQNVNLWTLTRAGAQEPGGTGVTTRFSHEPTGIAYNPSNGHLFVSDDDQLKVFELVAGSDGRYGTDDDTVTSFSTTAYGNTDPEDVAFDSASGDVLTVNGAGAEVFRIDPGPNGRFDGVAPTGDDIASQFDVGAYGAVDPEGLTYDVTRDTILVVDHVTRKVYEVDARTGELVNTIDISAAPGLYPAGIALAPGTAEPSKPSIYLVDRGIDNNTVATEDDGRLYEMAVDRPPLPNKAPITDAGPAESVTIPNAATLSGTVTDDGQPNGSMTHTWSKVSGPGDVAFADASALSTTATFSVAGTYVLRLTANDSELNGTDDTTVTALSPDGPFTLSRAVAASADDAEESASGSVTLTSSDLELVYDSSNQTVGIRFTNVTVPKNATITGAYVQFEVDEATTGATSLTVAGQAADDPVTFVNTQKRNISSRPRTAASVGWLPPPWQTVQVAGKDQRTPDLSAIVQEIVDRAGWASGNAMVIVVTGTGVRTAESFNGTRAPVLQITYTTGSAANFAPVVDSGQDQSVVLPNPAMLGGTVSDDGQPNPPGNVTTTWSQVSGPATATLADTRALTTTATFPAVGRYVFRLSADDGAFVSTDDTVVTVSELATVTDEIHFTFTGRDAVTFDWRGPASELRYGTTAEYGQTVNAISPEPVPISSAGLFWEATLTGLQPDTTYHYSIGNGPDRTFQTLPTGNFRFDEMADVGASTTWDKVTPTQAQIAADDPAFVLVPGDLTYANDVGQSVVDQHFNDVMAWSQSRAYMPVWGNHEWERATDDLRNYKGRFAFPNAQTSSDAPAPGCCGEDWYWFDAGGARFIAYPEPYTATTWTEWQQRADAIFAAAQADPSVHYIVTFGHRPAYSTGFHPGDPLLSQILDGFGDRYSKYVLNLNGHSHDYERFSPIHHVVHITGAGGGSDTEPHWSTTDSRTAFRALHLEHLRVDVTAQSMRIEAVCGPSSTTDDVTCAKGSVLDSVTIPAADREVPPTAALTVAPSSGTVPLTVTADASGSVDDDATPIAGYSFDFGDGTVVSQTTPTATHTYSSAASYPVTVTVTDTIGQSSSATTNVRVDPPPAEQPPVAALTLSPSFGPAPLLVTADGSGSTDVDSTPVSTYTFDFGDGTVVGPQAAATATHTYATIGTKTVTLTVTDTAGLAATVTRSVNVNTNLVGNPGFETNTTGWNTAGNSSVALARVSGGHSGGWAAKLTNTGTASTTCVLNDNPDRIGTNINAPYTARMWVKADAAGASLTLRFREYQGSTLVGTQQASIVLSTSWQQVYLTYTPTAPGSSSLDLQAIRYSTPSGTCFYADDIGISTS
jgi:PKD repeat protein